MQMLLIDLLIKHLPLHLLETAEETEIQFTYKQKKKKKMKDDYEVKKKLTNILDFGKKSK